MIGVAVKSVAAKRVIIHAPGVQVATGAIGIGVAVKRIIGTGNAVAGMMTSIVGVGVLLGVGVTVGVMVGSSVAVAVKVAVGVSVGVGVTVGCAAALIEFHSVSAPKAASSHTPIVARRLKQPSRDGASGSYSSEVGSTPAGVHCGLGVMAIQASQRAHEQQRNKQADKNEADQVADSEDVVHVAIHIDRRISERAACQLKA